MLKKILPLLGKHESTWAPNYEGPYVVKKTFLRRALRLSIMDEEDLARLVNSDYVKRYYAWGIQLSFYVNKGKFDHEFLV
jgi:hypothetical protein